MTTRLTHFPWRPRPESADAMHQLALTLPPIYVGLEESAMTTGFEPRILGILCTWCSYSGADGAGQARMQYPPNVRVVRVMCSGRVDPSFIIKALADGADGVLVCGCRPGDCHYINGNCKAAARMQVLGVMLASLGIERERVRLEWVSASEGARYAKLVAEMTEQVRALGPLKWLPQTAVAPAEKAG